MIEIERKYPMGMAEFERKREEKIDGVIYAMSPSHDYRHGIINNNINRSIGCGLKNSLCLVLKFFKVCENKS